MTDTIHEITPLAPMPLWQEGAPGALGGRECDKPTLTAFLPDPRIATGAAMVICPGGGYEFHASHEGDGYAVWLAEHGIAGIVLKYRVGPDGYRHPAMLNDAARAMRLTRANASAWNIDPGRVGMMGSSAGGHLTATLLTRSDAGDPASADPVERLGSRPDIGILCYPVITMGAHTHEGSRMNLLGDHPPAERIIEMSAEKQVTGDTPPCFIWHTWEDQAVMVENSLDFAAALRRAGVPFDLHIYQNGAHGMGLRGSAEAGPDTPLLPWAADCLYWLKQHRFA